MPLSTFPSPKKNNLFSYKNSFGIPDNIFNAIVRQCQIQITQTETGNSGIYTPTLFNDSNISSSIAYECQYMQVGNTVTVSGRVRFTATTTLTITRLGISLPIPSVFAAEENAAGVAASNAGDGYPIRANVADSRAELYASPVPITIETFWFTFTYQIIQP